MIVLTSLKRDTFYVVAGDRFQLVVTDGLGSKVVIDEAVTQKKTINYVASFRFALEDGRCPGFHLAGVFANEADLPNELRAAKMLEDLTKDQYANFASSCGVSVTELRK